MNEPDSTLADWLLDHPPSRDRFVQTVAGIADRHNHGEGFFDAVREFLDEATLIGDDVARMAALRDRPVSTGDEPYDAYLAALGEHLAAAWSLDRPAWTTEPSRFLRRFWFASPVAGFRPLLIAESPAAFRRRGLFISADSLRRV